MKKKKFYVTVLFVLLVVFFAGCYSPEEKEQEAAYKKQAKINAVNYIKEKYGFAAMVEEVCVRRLGDFDPFPDENVFVTMEGGGKNFLVRIDGSKETEEGFDNYQYDEIVEALEETLEELTGLPSEEVIPAFGNVTEYAAIKEGYNGLVATYFDGENLKEIFTGNDRKPAAVVSYINQEIRGIDVDEIKKVTGIENLLLVDYDSKAHYKTINQPWYNLDGTPIKRDVERHFPYINSYLVADKKKVEYVSCEKKEFYDVSVVTEQPEETVTIEKLPGFSENYDKEDARIVFGVYALETSSDKIYVMIPTEVLEAVGEKTPWVAVMADGEKRMVTSEMTDDGAYVIATIYTKDYEGPAEVSVCVTKD